MGRNRSDFHMIDSLLISVHAFARRVLMSLSVDEILLPRYMNFSTNLRELSLRVEMSLSWLKHMYSILSTFTSRPMPPAAYCRLCSRDLIWADVFIRSAISSASVIVSAGHHLLLALMARIRWFSQETTATHLWG